MVGAPFFSSALQLLRLLRSRPSTAPCCLHCRTRPGAIVSPAKGTVGHPQLLCHVASLALEQWLVDFADWTTKYAEVGG